MSVKDKPMSENIAFYEAGDFIVSAGIWRSHLFEFDSYEIGIRNKKTGEFKLIQNNNFDHQSVQEVSNAIAHLLKLSSYPMTENYTPEWFKKWFGEK